MAKIEIDVPEKRCTTSEMAVGDIGVVASGESYAGHILIRIFDGLVSLKDPSVVWLQRGSQIPLMRLERLYRAGSGTLVRMTL